MQSNRLWVYNTFTRRKEEFIPMHPPFVGMYVCGPTVYGEAHLGHARCYVTFDVVFRYLQYLGNKVRYVRNITDVGHLENDSDEGEDKIEKKARLEKLEPMEVVQRYTLSFHKNMEQLNLLPPSIEPCASGHIIEQIHYIENIVKHGYAYPSHGSVYFDVENFEKDYPYGQLSGRVTEDLLHNTRELDGQSEKRNPLDFALWKKAGPEHIMHWDSPWSEGFPGWHIECSAMSAKYLGGTFDIHGGGMDLLFPHHECEIAQALGSTGKQPVKYWLHNNMLTINGQKMSKSLNNFITLNELFSGSHPVLEKPYSPMTLRFLMLQGHYRNPIDFSNQALQDAQKAFSRLSDAYRILQEMKWVETNIQPDTEKELADFVNLCLEAMNDDFNTAVVLSKMFNVSSVINRFHSLNKTEGVSHKTFDVFKEGFMKFFSDILGLKPEKPEVTFANDFNELVDALIKARNEAKKSKEFELADSIRNILSHFGTLHDTPEKTIFEYEKNEK